ncbi:MAG: hypothetical protein ACFFC1_05940 [Promethearchaeota archaeon]
MFLCSLQLEIRSCLQQRFHRCFELIDSFKIERPEKYGGNVEYNSYEAMEKDYSAGNLNPPDLKPAVIKYLNQLLTPIREHFEKDKKARALYHFVQEADKEDKSKRK